MDKRYLSRTEFKMDIGLMPYIVTARWHQGQIAPNNS